MVEPVVLENGLTVLITEIPELESAAYELHIPGGIISDSEDEVGASLLLGELTARGAGSYSSRELSDRFDSLGIRHSESGGNTRYLYRGQLLAEKLPEALELVSAMVRKPTMPEDEIDPIKSLFIQDLKALQDNPARRSMEELFSRYYPSPFSRSSYGSIEGFEAVSIDSLRTLWEKQFRPGGAVLSVAGNIDKAKVLADVDAAFGDWSGDGIGKPEFGALSDPAAYHIEDSSEQVQIVMAHPSAKFLDSDYYAAKVAVSILSGGFSGKLFIEVREKRGLCYSVYARHSGTDQYGTLMAYAGTTTERAQETLDVMLDVIRGLKGEVTEEELARAKAHIKSSLIINQESVAARAGSALADWWYLERVRKIEEIKEGLDKVTLADIDQFMDKYPFEDCTILTLGKKKLEVK